MKSGRKFDCLECIELRRISGSKGRGRIVIVPVTPAFAEVHCVNLLIKIKVYVSFNLEHFCAFFEAFPGHKFKSHYFNFKFRFLIPFDKAITNIIQKPFQSPRSLPKSLRFSNTTLRINKTGLLSPKYTHFHQDFTI